MNIALLCVQENAADRPTMLDVVAMLSSKTKIMAEPKHPAYFNVRVGNEVISTTATQPSSVNDMTIYLSQLLDSFYFCHVGFNEIMYQIMALYMLLYSALFKWHNVYIFSIYLK